MFSFELFQRFILSKRAGSLIRSISRISILGIWLGVAALILVISVMNGFNRSIQKRLISVEPHLVVSFAKGTQASEIRSGSIFKAFLEEEGAEPQIFSEQDVIVRTEEGKIHMATAKGLPREGLMALTMMDRRDGRKPEDGRILVDGMKPGDLIVGLSLAEMVGVYSENPLVLIPPENLLLPPGEVPIYTQGTARGFLLLENDNIDKNTIFFIEQESFPRLQNTAGIERGIEVKFSQPSRAVFWKEKLVAMGMDAQTWRDRNASLFFALKVEKVVVAMLVGLSTLIAGLSIISVMVLLLIQKKKDIGNFLAMGMSKVRIRNLFVYVGLCLSAIGIVCGTVTGLIFCLLVDTFSQDVLPKFYEETNIPAEIHWLQVGAILALAFVFSFLTLRWAMRNLTKMSPSEALRG